MGADTNKRHNSRRGRGGGGGKGRGGRKNNNSSKNLKAERFGNANDIPLGPRIPFSEREGKEGGGHKGQRKDHQQEGELGSGSGPATKPRRLLDGHGGGDDGGGGGRKGGKGRGSFDQNKKNRKVEIQFNPKSKKSQEEKKEISWLNGKIEKLQGAAESGLIKNFKDFPLSKNTLNGLRDSEYEVPTKIQSESIGLALQGLDILGAAQTGSGKTLAFIIPVLEKLYRSRWSHTDGLGAVVITPTRELAYQIFQTLRKIGRYHEFSAGLIIGGKDLKFERKRMDQLNIVICTPGRLLQHMDENSAFDTSNLQILVLDEADRCLDMGFQRDMNAILEHLPKERQTLLYSATQTKSVKDLARLSLQSPVYVSVHENAEFATPEALQQSYVVCPLENKLDTLWSFLKHNRKSKIMVFMSSCKQVRFVNMLFCRMRPGISLLALHGSMHQMKRMEVYDEFCKKQAVCLFATDIAARGLDFPAVDWVLQLDCPEDSTTYIHRAGRTARFNKEGEALLVLLPSEEEAMLSQLKKRQIPIEKIEVNSRKMMSVTRKFESLLARDLTLKECAQRAFKAYLKSVFLMKNKEVFDVTQLDLPSFARSLGLAVAPRVRFLQKRGAFDQNQTGGGTDSGSDDERDHSEKVIEPTKGSATFDFNTVDDDDDVDTLFAAKKPAQVDDNEEDDDEFTLDLDEDHLNKKGKKVKTKASVAKKLMKKKIQINKKVVFDDDGEAVPDARRDKRSEMAKNYEMEDAPGIDVEKAKLALKEEDQYDKQLFRLRVQAKHREERKKAKLARKGKKAGDEEEAAGDDDGPTLKTMDSDESEDDYQPDLSWLPDPDKIYGPGSGNESGDDDDENMENDDDEEESEPESEDFSDDEDNFQTRGNKRQREVVNTDSESSDDEPPPPKKMLSKDSKKGLSKKHKVKTNEGLDEDLMEDLALQLLRGKR